MQSTLSHTGRILLALYFLFPGIMKFAAWDMHVTLMETHKMPVVPALLVLSGIIQIGASFCILANRHVAICAIILAGMVLVININLHDFWNVYEGVNAERETQNFVKNLGIFAGLLLLASMNLKQNGVGD
jgi:putative oxidoreductase